MKNTEVSVHIEALLPTPQGVGVFLSDGDKVIAIFVDPMVAAALSMSIQSVRAPRPLTHDLLVHVLNGLGVRVLKVLINDLKNDTFFARIHLLQENELGRNFVEIDARPSDAMVLAVRHDCPIRIAQPVWEAAADMRWALDQAREQTQGEDDAEGSGDNPFPGSEPPEKGNRS